MRKNTNMVVEKVAYLETDKKDIILYGVLGGLVLLTASSQFLTNHIQV